MPDGYKTLVPTSAKVPAEMMETVAGYRDEAEVVDKELAFAIAMVDEGDIATLQWLVAVLAGKLAYHEDRPKEECRYCGRLIVKDPTEGWVDPEATGDDAVWREVCDKHDTFDAVHEPK